VVFPLLVWLDEEATRQDRAERGNKDLEDGKQE
jgi:hypothetical protein